MVDTPRTLAELIASAPDGGDFNAQELRDFMVSSVFDFHVDRYGAVGDDVTDDTTAIQAAIDAAEAVGGRVLFDGEKTYLVTAALVINSNDVTVDGRGATLHRTGTGNGFSIGGASAGASISGVQVRNLEIDGPSVVGTQVSGSGIRFEFADHCDLVNVDVHGFGSSADQGAVEIAECSYITVDGCRLHDSENGLITGQAASPVIPEASDCVFRGNLAYNNWGDGIHSQHSVRILYNNNICFDNAEAGIDLLGDDGDTIVGNVCYSNGQSGIEVGNTTASGAADKNHTILGNSCQGNGDHGILINDWAEYIVVFGNLCEGNTGSGIQLAGIDGVSFINVSGNTCEGNTQRGIYLVNDVLTDCLITGNIIRNNANRGIYITNAGGGDPTGNVITNNYAEGNTTGDIDDNSSGANTIRGNFGPDITENSGTATLANGTTSIAVNHGVNGTPGVGDIMVTPVESLGSASFWFVSAPGATQFTINVNVDPGQDVDFGWQVRLT